MKEHCEQCKYWKALVATTDGDLYGECRRYPPEMAQRGLADRNIEPIEDQNVLLIGEWFLTKKDDFCGEFFKRQPPPTPSTN